MGHKRRHVFLQDHARLGIGLEQVDFPAGRKEWLRHLAEASAYIKHAHRRIACTGLKERRQQALDDRNISEGGKPWLDPRIGG